MSTADTIAAISSAVGPAARMIVRASGPLVPQLREKLVGSASADRLLLALDANNRSAEADPTRLKFNGLSVPAWVYLFHSPHSVTGEDVLELHIPGNPLIAKMLLDELIRLGARQAEPGEFTARAYFNGRIGLSEAEGVAATIAAHSERELAAARQLLAGELSWRLRPIMDEIANTLALVEVGIDFSEEDVSFLSQNQIVEHLSRADASLESLLKESARFDRLSHEPSIVLIGRPNAGKSTLLNALAGHDRAVVSPQAGTTRDAIWAHVKLKRGIVRILDVAGIEDEMSNDLISRSMQSQAKRAIEEADFLVLVRDCTDLNPTIELFRNADLVVESKSDLLSSQDETNNLRISARTNANMQLLRDLLDVMVFGATVTNPTLALNARHVRAIEIARDALMRAAQQLPQAGSEILALELRESLDHLGQVLGVVTPDEVLGRVFSAFCIGK